MMSVNLETACPYAEDDDLLRRYVTGELDGETADRFEQHFVECDRCWNQMQMAAELRSALRARRRLRKSARTRRVSTILATAAAAVLTVLGVWQLRRPDPDLVLRAKTTSGLVVHVSPSEAGRVLSWNAVAGADRYLLQLFRADGLLVLQQETEATHYQVAVTEEGLYAKVEALNKMGSVVARSGLKPLK